VLRSIPTATLTVVGDGDDRPRLTEMARQLGLAGRVHFAGRVDDEGLDRAYASCAVFALPARARLGKTPEGEGFGLVFIEAAYAGLPTVAGRAGGAQEAIIDGVTGFLVDPDDDQAVAATLVALLDDEELRVRLGAAGEEMAARLFSFERFESDLGEQLNMIEVGIVP
jgi:phosphatidylinositol alpha-1,6-mannosyltransferase